MRVVKTGYIAEYNDGLEVLIPRDNVDLSLLNNGYFGSLEDLVQAVGREDLRGNRGYRRPYDERS